MTNTATATDTNPARNHTDASRVRVIMATHRAERADPTDAAVERAESTFAGSYRFGPHDYTRRERFDGSIREMNVSGFVDYAMRRAAEAYTYDDNTGERINRPGDAVDVLRALGVLERRMSHNRAVAMYCHVIVLDNTSRFNHYGRANHRLMRLAIARIESDLADRARELSREASRIRRALKR
tara:strand:+ start:2037 stop:2585 length:549 start_codon:yes stop_codon:yes gene_type:complete